MKALALTLFLFLTGCTTYQTTKIGKNKIMVSKTTTFLAFHGGTVYTCGLNNDGIVISCQENNIETEQAKKDRQERESKELERKKLQNQNYKY